ncbi:unnamed protein product [Spirodela intermedia]|uniref:Aspartate aminotransferase n=1 Tax=Spirodela intermedia TaxID=51605 RepID=A0A7I8KLM3_SPIIN|nr:unnamed protein product [Spirodela intermedia]
MTVAANVSRFEGVTMAPPDPILGVSEAFKADTNDLKLNLGVGAYRTEELQPYVLNVVKKQTILFSSKEEYAFSTLYSKDIHQGKSHQFCSIIQVATVQGLSGTGSLRLGAAFIQRYFPEAKALISAPTWGNHKNIFNDAGVPWSEYRYYDPRTVGLDFDGMIADIKAAPDGSFIVLHGCAHNPTGIDPTPKQWEQIADVTAAFASTPSDPIRTTSDPTQGFASGDLDTDASSVRLFVSRGLELLVAQSYSKNLGLYAERVGAMNNYALVRVKSQLKRLARPMYSNPPVHGARIVASVMAGRIKNVRQRLFDNLSEKGKSGKDWSFILQQIGMFSFTGLNKAQVASSMFLQSDNMTDKWHVYMTKDGRISLAGLSLAKCEYLADAIIDSFHNVS